MRGSQGKSAREVRSVKEITPDANTFLGMAKDAVFYYRQHAIIWYSHTIHMCNIASPSHAASSTIAQVTQWHNAA